MKNTGSNFLKKVWRLTRAYWFSEEKWAARGLLAVIVALNLGHVYVLVLLNQWNNTFYNTMQNHDKEGFFSALGDFCILATFYILIAVYELYLQQMLQNKWRRWITADYLKNWLKGRTYYLLELTDSRTDNPDQRLSEDLRLFVTLTIQLSLGLLKATVTLVSFMAILWILSGSIQIAGFTIYGYMVWIAILYAVVGTYLTAKIGHPLIGLNFQQQRYEADFRFGLVRLRENSEGVAFYSGESQEKEILVRRFRNVFNNFKELMKRQKKLTWFTSGYEQIAIIFPLVVAAPRYFSNQMQLGGLIQTASAFGRVQDALSFFVASYSQLAEWRAVVNRLTGFVDHMEQVQEIRGAAVVQVQRDPAPNVAVKNLDLALPNGQNLLQDLDFSVAPGETLLITGPSGCGKSTLLRTLAGIWPFGRGNVLLPQGQTVLFLPQKPYLPLGSLRDVLLYPGGNEVGDSVIKAIMNDCKLAEFTDRLDQTANWAQLLSLGEQQRVAFARVLLQNPQWLFLDEATSALDEPTERQLYELLAQKLQTTTIVSVGHRQTLNEFHQKRLIFGADGTWQIQPIE